MVISVCDAGNVTQCLSTKRKKAQVFLFHIVTSSAPLSLRVSLELITILHFLMVLSLSIADE